MAIVNRDANAILPQIQTAEPLYAINSTAYAVKLTWKMEDSLESGIILAFRPDGDPIPSNIKTVESQIPGKADFEPSFSMTWAWKKVMEPSPGDSNLLEDSCPGIDI